MSHHLRTETGDELEVKEGIVLDIEDKPVHAQFAHNGPRVRTVQVGSSWAPLIFFPAVALLLTFGLTLIVAFAVAFIAGWLLLSLKRMLFPRY